MGSIILVGRGNEIVDGQQRLSSLTLLLMYLRNRLLKQNKHHSTVEQIIYSEVRGKKSFNINVPERQACMEMIFKDDLDNFDATNAGESIQNLCDAYTIIEDNFPKSIFDDETAENLNALLIFCDWLIEKVYFIEIVAQEEADASKIFITMNDRGLSLTPTEMLKSYSLSEIKSLATRDKLNKHWKTTMKSLRRDNDKGDEIFIRTWLRAQYADIQFIRDENAPSQQISLFGDEPIGNYKEDFSDFSQIGGEFHKWVYDNQARLNLKKPTDWERLIDELFYFANIYLRIRRAENKFAETTKYVYYNARLNFTLQPLFLMAPICFKDDEATVTQKINLAARFIDLWINARVIGGKSLEYNNIQNQIFRIAKDIRSVSISELARVLKGHYDDLIYSNSSIRNLRLHNKNKRYIKNILARITSFIEEQTGCAPHYVEYMTAKDDPFEIEHILCNDFERFKNDFEDKEDFDNCRNAIGALLLLRKSINASLKDNNYPQKLVKYRSTEGNIYAASLGEQTYRNNPRLEVFINKNNLSFKPFDKFGKKEIRERTQLVTELINLIWNIEEFND